MYVLLMQTDDTPDPLVFDTFDKAEAFATTLVEMGYCAEWQYSICLTTDPDEYMQNVRDEMAEQLRASDYMPQEDDIFILHDGTITSEGKTLARFHEWDEQRAFIRTWTTEQSYFPNVWLISDHGNAHLLTGIYA